MLTSGENRVYIKKNIPVGGAMTLKFGKGTCVGGTGVMDIFSTPVWLQFLLGENISL